MKKIILILIAIAAVAEGCEKSEYEQTLKKIYGDYTLKTYTVNGVDSLNLYKDSLGSGFHFYYDEINSVNVLEISGNTTTGTYGNVGCQWRLSNDYNTLIIYSAGGAFGTGPFGRDITPEWEMLKLFNNKIWMKTNYNNKEYIIDLEKK